MKYLQTFILFILVLPMAFGQNQVEIDSVKGVDRDAIRIIFVEDDGIQIDSAGDDGLNVGGAGRDGLHVIYAGNDGIHVVDAGDDGVQVSESVDDGVYVILAGDDGIQVDSAGGDGFYVMGAGRDGLHVSSADNDGIHVANSGDDGVHVFESADDGIIIDLAGDDGVEIFEAMDDGVLVNMAGGDGVYVNEAGGLSMNIQGEREGESDDPAGHIAQVFNRSDEGSADVLALKVGQTSSVEDTSHFITFFNGSDAVLGSIHGNGATGVEYASTGADYAECLPRLHGEEVFQAGDIIGVFEGKISRKTKGATNVMVVTDRAAVLGNQMDEESGPHEKVSFIGQVPVRIKGEVRSGDWIVPSDDNDGTGIAIAHNALTLNHQVVGQAWESSSDPGIKRVNTAVGLDQSEVLKHIIKSQQDQIDELRSMLLEVRSGLTDLGSTR